ncbi:MAG: alpha/beta fold hydrolase [Hydrogenophaga sp.]|uniref:alpha/beta fold hydrolase BchO n=1 Tax=Hydrogenophaga sp. TaxID=1904254 RepID=UPI002638CD25|nr:alpha/beta fold hydrolase BchO [Hydrogenophaga sp.]MDM7941703.1 alpha/beta fold hydrolase [Hydrogenophaga sp.]
MAQGLDWQRDGPHWPHHELSSFVWASGLQWHVQRFAGPANAPCLVLLHGTGASTHSWRDLAPLLARRFEVVAMDLPGHAFTGMPPGGVGAPQFSLPGMARAVHGLLQTLDIRAAMLVGHSAGAAVAVRMCLDGLAAPRSVLGLNAALMPLGGLAGQLFSPVAKLMASAPFVPRLFAWHAKEPAVLQRLLQSTGSTLDPAGTALYQRLVRSPGHAAGALGMMANWDLDSLWRDLPRLAVPLDLLVGERDRTVPPEQATRAMARLSPALKAQYIQLDGLGHLAHEEQPDTVARLVFERFDARA